jgi:hypothetical protein
MMTAGGSAMPAVRTAAVSSRRQRLVDCCRQGRNWLFQLDAQSVSIEHCRGMTYLSALLANPGYQIPAVDLVAGPGRPGEMLAHGDDSRQPILDDAARSAYRERLATLAMDIDEYEAMNDLARVARARAEYDWLVDELAAAIGLGGRVRQFSNSAERARISVGKAIRRAMNRIAAADRTIGDELRATIHTGLCCSYQPR